MADEEEGFTIRDRRRRSPAEDDAPAGPPSPAAPAREPAPAARAAEGREAVTDPGFLTPALDSPPLELDLRPLIMMFANSALSGLGEVADPVTGQRHIDLAQAEEGIDVLLLLREKTEGNRTAEESAALDDALYDLQMRFDRMTELPPP